MIDKTKKSNRRCVNCLHWPGYQTDPEGYPLACPKYGEPREYYNCCKRFEWDPKKEYAQDGGVK